MPNAQPSIPDFLYGTAWKEDRTAALTELAIRSGFRAIDTANQRRHYFEAGVGQGLAAVYRAGHRHPCRSFSSDQVHLSGRPGPSPPLRSCRSAFPPGGAIHGQFACASWHGPRRQLCSPRHPLLTPTGPPTILKPGRQCSKNAMPDAPAFSVSATFHSLNCSRWPAPMRNRLRSFRTDAMPVADGTAKSALSAASATSSTRASLSHRKQQVLAIPASPPLPRRKMPRRPRLSSLLLARSACSRLRAPPAPITCGRTLKASGIAAGCGKCD